MALRAFRTLMALRPLVSFPFPALSCPFQNRRPRHSVAPSNLEGDVVGWHRKVGECADLPTTQNRQRLPLPTSPVVGEEYLAVLPKAQENIY